MIECPYCGEAVAGGSGEGLDAELRVCMNCLNALVIERREEGLHGSPIPGETDFREVCPADSVMGGVFGELGEAVGALPVLPEVGQRVSTMLHDPLMSMGELAEVLNQAPQISLQLLKLANSVAYGGSSAIDDVELACARLGLRVVANTVSTVLHGNLYRSANRAHRGLMQNLWRHAVVSALFCDGLTQQASSVDRHLAYEAGLLHDIGMVLLDLITVRYVGRVGRLRESMELLEDVLDRFHPLVGLCVAQHWGLPQPVRFAIYFHKHDAVPLENGAGPVVDSVRVASDLTHTMGLGLRWENGVELAENGAAKRLGLSVEDLAAFRESNAEKVEAALAAFCS